MRFRRATVCVLLVASLVVFAGCMGSVPASAPDGAETTTTASDGTDAGAGDPAVNGSFEMHYINVGQSSSVLVIGPGGETLLYDTGHFQDDGEHVLAYLRAQGVERIDHLVVSHNDADHIGGNAAVIEYYETQADGVGAVYDPGIAASTGTYAEYLDAIEAHDVTLYETREGDSLGFGGANVSVDVLGPPEPYLEGDARNENSIVLKFTYGATSFLLTGDAEDDQEAYLVREYGPELNATVLKAGHHGSASSTGGALLDAASPQAVVVSSAYESQYGHPSEAVLDRLGERSIPTYWTATHGTVVLVSDGQKVSVRTQQAAPTVPQRLREGNPVEPGSGGDVVERRVISPNDVDDRSSATTTDDETGGDGETAADGGTASSALAVATVHADAAGDDRENLNDEYVVFENTGDAELDLSGWTVSDEAGHSYAFPEGTTLAPGETLTLYTGSGSDTESEYYWGSGSPVWNNGGDTVIVRNDQGELVREETYA